MKVSMSNILHLVYMLFIVIAVCIMFHFLFISDSNRESKRQNELSAHRFENAMLQDMYR